MKESWLILVLILGLNILYLSPAVYSQSSGSVRTIEYCRLFEPGVSKNREVFTEATLYVPRDGGPAYFYSPLCNNRDFFAIGDFSKIGDRRILDAQLKPENLQNLYSRFKVRMRGRIVVESLPAFGHLSWMRAKFKVLRLQSVTLINEVYPPPDYDAVAPIIDRNEALRTTNAELMFILFGTRQPDERQLRIMAKPPKYYMNGRPTKTPDLKMLGIEKLRVGTNDVIKNNQGWIVKGDITITKEKSKDIILLYENHYSPDGDNSYILETARFIKK